MITAPSVNTMTQDRAPEAGDDDRLSTGTQISGGAFEAVLASVQGPAAPAAVRHSAPPASEVFDAPPADSRQVRLDTLRKEARRQDLKGDEAPPPTHENEDVAGEFAPDDARGSSTRALKLPEPTATDAGASAGNQASSPRTMPVVAPDEGDQNMPVPAKADAPPGVEKPLPSRVESGENVRPVLESNLTPVPVAAANASPGEQAPLAQLIGRSLASGGDNGAALRADRAGMTADRVSMPANKGDAATAKTQDKSAATDSPDDAEEAPETDFERMVRSIRLHQGSHRSQASIELDPPELGRVRVEAQLTGQRLELQIHTETPEARQVLSERIAELRDALQQQGLTWGDVQWQDDGGGSSLGGAHDGPAREGESRFASAAAVDVEADAPVARPGSIHGPSHEPDVNIAVAVPTAAASGARALDIRA